MAWTAAGVLLALAVGKAVVGFLFGFPVLIADAVHSAGDVAAAGASAFGLWLAARKPSRRFPYGLYKAESLATLVIGLLIGAAAVELGLDGWHTLLRPAYPRGLPAVPLAMAAVAMVASFTVSRAERRVAEKINSASLLANARENLFDVISSAVVLVGIVLDYMQVGYAEGAAIILIALFILRLAAQTVWGSLLSLLDANTDPDLTRRVEAILDSIYGVKGTGEVRIRQAGPVLMVECVIRTKGSLPLYRAHELADQAEEAIRSQIQHIESVFIHEEPVRQAVTTVLVPVESRDGLASRVYPQFGRAPYYAVVRIGPGGTAVVQDYYTSDLQDRRTHAGLHVVREVARYKIDAVITPRIGEIAYYALRDHLADIYRTGAGEPLGRVVEDYHGGRLMELTEPEPVSDEHTQRGPRPKA